MPRRLSYSFRENLAGIQDESLPVISLLAGILSYVLFAWLVLPFSDAPATASAWLGDLVLALGTIGSLLLASRGNEWARPVLVFGILTSIVFFVSIIPAPAGAYLFLIPVICSSILLGQFYFFFVTGISCVIVVLVGAHQIGGGSFGANVALPFGVILLTATTSFLWVRNLHSALEGVWGAFEWAHHNEQVARDRQAELKRVLKSLDEAYERQERLNDELADAYNEANEARRVKQRFVQNISHELRTPLNLIVGFSELMIQSPDYYGNAPGTAYLHDLTIVYRNARHLQSLVNDVLDLARIEAAQMTIVPEEILPFDLVHDVVNSTRRLVEARGLELKISIEPDLPVLQCDPIRVRQVLINLLNNAARFTERGGIEIGVQHHAGQIVFSVSDTGIGIAPKDLEQVFEEFYQQEGSSTRRRGGVGLGLAISKRFVELHRGRIWAESKLGEGSTFYFSLPIGEKGYSETFRGLSEETQRKVTGREKGQLLLVTQSPSASALVQRYVRGHPTVVVSDLGQVKREAESFTPRLVIVDRACEKLAGCNLDELARLWNTPTYVMACSLPGEERSRQSLDVDGYLIKPVSPENLLSLLRRFGELVDRVLVVAQDHDFSRLLTRMLESGVRRYDVIVAFNEQEGLGLIQYHKPDLVIMDLDEPMTSNSHVVSFIHDVRTNHRIPIVVTSTQDDVSYPESLPGEIIISKSGGLAPGEVVQLAQGLLEMSGVVGSTANRVEANAVRTP